MIRFCKFGQPGRGHSDFPAPNVRDRRSVGHWKRLDEEVFRWFFDRVANKRQLLMVQEGLWG